ncbi:MAG TPA: hypothetical protein VHG29_13085 [Novosphingobium sp.]|nr:hypothetical protein [Novosphingobium sp.]
MKTVFFSIVIAALVIMVVVSLVRGIIAFMKSTKLDLERDEGTGASEMQLLQNKMMFNRIKYQAAAVLVVAILLAISR